VFHPLYDHFFAIGDGIGELLKLLLVCLDGVNM
jgi:hypothetical protein